LYLVAVLDIYTRLVLGWVMHERLEASVMIAAV
jgi:hypothetical protein